MAAVMLTAPDPQWHELDERHQFRFVKFGNKTVGGVLKHLVKGTEDVWCEPGLVQWERVTQDLRPLFTIESEPGANISLLPFIVCEICGDAGWIVSGQWHPKHDHAGMSSVAPMKVLEGVEGEDEEVHSYQVAIRRELGDKVEAEERNADRKLYDVGGNLGGDVVIPNDEEAAEERIGYDDEDEPLFDKHDLLDDGALVTDAQQHEWAEREEARRAIDREVKDSGHRHVFETGAQRDRAAGKGRYDLLQWMALERIAVIMEKGADKYEARNWERGMPMSRYIDSAVRHLKQHMLGLVDEDHLGQAGWNILSAMQTEMMIEIGLLPPELNDLPDYDPKHSNLAGRLT